MVKKDINEIVEVPEGTSVSMEDNLVIISGPNGTIKMSLNNPKIKIQNKGKEISLSATPGSKREKALIQTYKAHIHNAFKGSKENFVYKLKICSGHFPMNVSVSDNVLIIKNFIGEKVPRKVTLKKGANVRVEGTLIIVEGPNKELTGQIAAEIEQATRRPGYDKRIFQDGIYIIEKAGKVI